MFDNNVLVNPQRFFFSSESIETTNSLFSTAAFTPDTRVYDNSPFGPFTCTLLPFILTSTHDGIAIAFFPIFDIIV
jgi:hypothetical protein